MPRPKKDANKPATDSVADTIANKPTPEAVEPEAVEPEAVELTNSQIVVNGQARLVAIKKGYDAERKAISWASLCYGLAHFAEHADADTGYIERSHVTDLSARLKAIGMSQDNINRLFQSITHAAAMLLINGCSDPEKISIILIGKKIKSQTAMRDYCAAVINANPLAVAWVERVKAVQHFECDGVEGKLDMLGHLEQAERESFYAKLTKMMHNILDDAEKDVLLPAPKLKIS